MSDEIKGLIDTASGREKADLVLKNCNIVNVFTQEIVKGDIAVKDGKIAGIGSYEGNEEIDIKGCYAVPGLIDSHVHIESTMVTPGQFARAVVPRGTTTVIADPHEIANVCGLDGIKYMLEESENLPLNVYIMFPSCVPATPFENSGAKLEAEDIRKLVNNKRALGLGEMMNYQGVISASGSIIEKLQVAEGKVIDGHAPRVHGKDLNAYAAAGIKTEHECTSIKEMVEKLRLGFYIQVREGSAARDLEALVKGINSENMRRCMFCTDDRQLEDIITDGHIDNNVRLAIKNGINPIAAITIATLNAAECYGLDKLGAIAPGYTADIVIVEDLEGFTIQRVFKGGRLVAEKGELTVPLKECRASNLTNSVKITKKSSEMFRIKLKSNIANVIRVQPGSLITTKVQRIVETQDGCFKTTDGIDIVKLAVIERHKGTGNIGLGLLENLNIKNMAIASTIAHDSHNLIVAGDNDIDMLTAVEELEEKGGGITICSGGKVVRTLSLPVAGLLSNRPFEEVDRELKEMLKTAYKMGVNKKVDPFMILSFLALPVIPGIRLTDKGLFDVEKFSFIDIS